MPMHCGKACGHWVENLSHQPLFTMQINWQLVWFDKLVWSIITIVFGYILRNISVCVNLFYPKFAWPTLFHSAVWFHSRLKTGEAQDGMKMRMYSQQGKTWHSWVMLYRLWQSCIVTLLKSPPRTPYQQPHIYTIQCLKLKLFVLNIMLEFDHEIIMLHLYCILVLYTFVQVWLLRMFYLCTWEQWHSQSVGFINNHFQVKSWSKLIQVFWHVPD